MKKTSFSSCALRSRCRRVPGAQGKRFITEKDLFKFTWIADPQISPDGIDGRVRPRDGEREGQPLRDVAVRGAGRAAREAAAAADAGHPRHLAALGARRQATRVRARGREGRQGAAAADLSAAHGRRRSAADHRCRRAARASPVWSPDGTDDRLHQRDRRGREEADDPKPAAEHKSDVEVVTRAVYRANGNPGYVDNEHHAHIFTIAGRRHGVDRQAAAEAAHRRRVRRARHRSGRLMGRRCISSRRASPSRTTTRAATSSMRSPAAGGAIAKIAGIDGGIGNIVGVARRQADRVRRHAARQADPFLQPAGSVGRRRGARQHAEEPDRGLRLRHRRRHRRRSVARRAARTASRSSGRRTARRCWSCRPRKAART